MELSRSAVGQASRLLLKSKPVTYAIMGEAVQESFAELEQSGRYRRPGRGRLILLAIAIVALAGAGAFVVAFDSTWLPSTTGLFRQIGEMDRGHSDNAVLTDLMASQQSCTEQLKALSQELATQKADIARVSEQLSTLVTQI